VLCEGGAPINATSATTESCVQCDGLLFWRWPWRKEEPHRPGARVSPWGICGVLRLERDGEGAALQGAV
jgi:hypothetical protein